MESDTSPRPRQRYLLDRKWQLAVTGRMAGVALVAGLLWVVANYFLARSDHVETLTGTQLALVAIALNAIVFTGIVALFAWVTVRETHSVVGPALVLERAVRRMRAGEFDSRLKLRDRDYLKSLSDALQELSTHLEKRSGVERELQKALQRSDWTSARTIAGRLVDAPFTSGLSEEREAA